jgi:hypothetical protein
MEVKYEDEDLGLLLLCSLPSSFASFRDTILLSRDELTISDVYEALQSREKMKGMVHSDGSSSKGDALQVRGRIEQRSSNESNDRFKSQESRGRSKSRPPKKFCKYCKKKTHFIEECWTLKNKENKKIIRMVRPLLFLVLGILLIQEIVWLSLSVVFLVMMNGYLIQRVHFISALIEIGSVLINLCRMVM